LKAILGGTHQGGGRRSSSWRIEGSNLEVGVGSHTPLLVDFLRQVILTWDSPPCSQGVGNPLIMKMNA